MAADGKGANASAKLGPRLLQSSGFKFDKASKGAKSNLKKASTKVKSAKVVNGTKKEDATSTASSPSVPQFDKETLNNFPSGKLDSLDTMICKHCKKVILKRTAKDHIAGCLKSKQEKARKKKEAREAAQRAKERAERGDDAEDDDDDTNKGKKRKAEDDEKDKEPKKKKKKEEPKPKQAKTKGPVDVEKQCGVQLPNGAQCARSLTCKSHSMGAKRAVPGRSLPYDMLLANYQKKNQARQQKAAIDANAPLQEEDLDTALTGPIDSDEERDAVMTAVSRSLSRPQPLVTHTIFPTRRKYQLIRMKEMLSNALNGNRNSNIFAVPRETPVATNGDGFAVPAAAPVSAASTGVGMAQPGIKAPSRKPSVDPT
jgi:SAGA-associated factor 73